MPAAQWQRRMEELKVVILNSQSEIESLQEQQDELLRQLEGSMKVIGVQPPDGSSSSRERIASFVSALKNNMEEQKRREVEGCVRVLVERVAAETLEKQLRAATARATAMPVAVADNSGLQLQLARTQAEAAALRAQLDKTGTVVGSKRQTLVPPI